LSGRKPARRGGAAVPVSAAAVVAALVASAIAVVGREMQAVGGAGTEGGGVWCGLGDGGGDPRGLYAGGRRAGVVWWGRVGGGARDFGSWRRDEDDDGTWGIRTTTAARVVWGCCMDLVETG
jgi:hypothetical protein